MPRARWNLVVFAVALAPAIALAQGGTRARWARLALEGPLTAVELDFADGSGASLEIALAAGERRSLEVPLGVPAALAEDLPQTRVDGAGSVRFDGWSSPAPEVLEAEWGRLSFGLRQRPRPPPLGAPDPSGPPPAALLLSCAGFALAVMWRRRGVLAFAVGMLGAAGALVVAVRPADTGRVLQLFEGEGKSPAWAHLRAGRERLEVQAGDVLRVQTRPERAALRSRVRAGPQGLTSTLIAAHATLYHAQVRELGAGLLRHDAPNRLFALSRCWVRESHGTWTHHGPWGLGEPLPAALPGPGEPPGWLNPALPLGTGILIGEREFAPPPAGGRADPTWVRVVGF